MRKLSLWRHGDVFIQSCAAIPASATRLPHLVLAKGELTGHAHRIAERDAAELFRHDDVLYLRVAGEQATVTHEEHRSIALKRAVPRRAAKALRSPIRLRSAISTATRSIA